MHFLDPSPSPYFGEFQFSLRLWFISHFSCLKSLSENTLNISCFSLSGIPVWKCFELFIFSPVLKPLSEKTLNIWRFSCLQFRSEKTLDILRFFLSTVYVWKGFELFISPPVSKPCFKRLWIFDVFPVYNPRVKRLWIFLWFSCLEFPSEKTLNILHFPVWEDFEFFLRFPLSGIPVWKDFEIFTFFQSGIPPEKTLMKFLLFLPSGISVWKDCEFF